MGNKCQLTAHIYPFAGRSCPSAPLRRLFNGGACRRTAPLRARPGALVTRVASARSGAAPSGATRHQPLPTAFSLQLSALVWCSTQRPGTLAPRPLGTPATAVSSQPTSTSLLVAL